MKPGGMISKMFLGSYFFTIALREKEPLEVTSPKPFRAHMVLPANKDRWAADPILVDDGSRTWLFYESVVNDKGRIEVREITEGCKTTEPTVLLEDWCHYSYPFVFKADGVWYMIPESSAANEVRLYRAASFPFEWELQTVLLHEQAVDTTVFEWGGLYWMLTFIPEDGTERVLPRAYTVRNWQEPELHEAAWPGYDALRVRGAGQVFWDGNQLLRPAQISQAQRYGDGLTFYRIEPTEVYQETQVFEVSEKNLEIRGYFVDGLHTYSTCRRFEAIDIRCRAAEPLKIMKRLIH